MVVLSSVNDFLRSTSMDTVSSADPMRAITKIISLIDRVRYRNWLRSLVLYISRLYGRIPRTYEWNGRKRIFDPNQIRRAWQVLNEQRWLVPASEMWGHRHACFLPIPQTIPDKRSGVT